MWGRFHPFSHLVAEELAEAAAMVREEYAPDDEIVFKSITLLEPDKDAALEYLDAEHAAEDQRRSVDRCAFLSFYRKHSDLLHEAVVNLTKKETIYHHELNRLLHGPGDRDELVLCEKVVLSDPDVEAEFKQLDIKDKSLVVVEPWIYGSDGFEDERRQYQCFLFLKNPDYPMETDSNHYARPIPTSPVVDIVLGKVVRIDHMPTGGHSASQKKTKYKVPPASEYMPKYQKVRQDLKPLNVIQPEGASFTVVEDFPGSHLIKWQKWRFRMGFNAREGMILYDVRYDGRPLFYSISLSDMNIPYADPRPPFHRKAAFDLGDAGAGYTANSLKLGCDCLGAITYLSAILSDVRGNPYTKDNCVCIHEQDAGIGWKHTNFRTNSAAITRRRELVLQSIITVANYEYILAFILDQTGELTYEVRATGIVSTQPIDEGVEVPWGTVVHPGVLAAHHQHIFSLRVDPMIDGIKNSLVCEEAHAMPRSADLNPHGTGYVSSEYIVKKSGGYDLDTQKNRTFKIVNRSSLSDINGKPAAYKIAVPDFQKMLASPDSWHHKRAEFADHNIYVTRYRPNQLYAAGQYTNQSRGGAGVRTWASAGDEVVDEDIVVWVQFGMNHIPRTEDFPVMPCEILKVSLKPSNFFSKNPAIDVPQSSQTSNKSCQLPVPGHNIVANDVANHVNGDL